MTSSRFIRARSGFTLVELVVATGITVVLAAMLISITSGMLAAWNRSRGDLTSSNQAKLGLDQLAEDLACLVQRRDGNVWFAATVTGEQTSTGDATISDAAYPNSGANKCKPVATSTVLTPASENLSDYRFGHIGVWLRFFTNEPSANDAVNNVSTTRAVSYQIARVPVSTASSHRYFLFRSSVRPGPFGSGGSALDESVYKRSTLTTGYLISDNNDYNDPGGVNAGEAEPGSIRRPVRSQIIGNDVIDFGVRIYVRDSTGALVERFPVDRTLGTPPPVWSFLATSAPSGTIYGVGTAPTGVSTIVRDFPVVIEVMMRVLSDEGARLIAALETGRTSPPGGAGAYDSYWWDVARANSTVYTRRIEVPTATMQGNL